MKTTIDFEVLQKLRATNTFTDLKLIPSETGIELLVHKVVLAASSGLIREALSSNATMAEYTIPKPAVSEGTLPSSLGPYFTRVIDWVYKNQNLAGMINDGFSADNCFIYYGICKVLKLESLKTVILHHITDQLLNMTNSSKFLLESVRHETTELSDTCRKLISQNMKELISNQSLQSDLLKLPYPDFLQLVKKDDLIVDSEDSIFNLVIRYIDHREKFPQKTLNKTTEEESKVEVVAAPGDQPQNPPAPAPVAAVNDPKAPEGLQINMPIVEIVNGNVLDMFQTALKRMEITPLTDQQKKDLLLQIRYRYMSHEMIMNESKNPLLAPFREILLEGLSAKLKNFETSSQQYIINLAPRHHYTSRVEEPYNPKEFVGNYMEDAIRTSQDGKNFMRQPKPNAADPKQINKSDHRVGVNLLQNARQIKSPHNEKAIQPQNPNVPHGALPPGFLSMSNPNTDQQRFLQQSNLVNNRNELNYNIQPHKSQDNYFSKDISNLINHKNEDDIVFEFEYDFDENGALFWLGTLGRTNEYENPYTRSQIKVFFSSMGRGSYEDFVGRSLVNCRTLNEPNAFMGIDFGPDRYLVPTCYTIKNRDSTRHIMLNWLFEGSVDFKTWFILDKRIHKTDDPSYNKIMERERQMIERRGGTTTWSIDQNYLKMAARTLSQHHRDFMGFRFFRVKQISRNSSGADNLALSGIEIYGTAKGLNWRFY